MSECRPATRTDHDTVPDFPAGRVYSENTRSRVRDASCKWLCVKLGSVMCPGWCKCMVWVG